MASRTPDMLRKHIQEILEDPSKPLDPLLLSSDLWSGSSLDQNVKFELAMQLFHLLSKLQQDPTPVVKLLECFIEPFSFDQLRSVDPPIDFAAGLDLTAAPFHGLALSVIEKAAEKASYADVIAGMPEVVAALIRLYLCVDDSSISTSAGAALLSLLKISRNVPPLLDISTESGSSYGSGQMWKRIFGDRDIYSLFFSICSFDESDRKPPKPQKAQKTLWQARLLHLVPEIGAMDWNSIFKSHHPEIERQYGLAEGEGLLQFAAAKMVDFNDDVLMHITLIDFYKRLIASVREPIEPRDDTVSISLRYLIDQGIHQRIAAIYTNYAENSLEERAFLYGPSSKYLAVYVMGFPGHFEQSELVGALRNRLYTALNLTKSQWIHNESPSHDLHLLSSMPPSALLPYDQTGWSRCPIASFTSPLQNPDALNALAELFRGPYPLGEVFPPPDPQHQSAADLRYNREREASRALFFAWLSRQPHEVFSQLVNNAHTPTLKELALASIRFMTAIAMANWLPLSADGSSTLLSPESAAALSSYPATGLELVTASRHRNSRVMSSSHALMSFLMESWARFSADVGRAADRKTAPYQIAYARDNMLRLTLRAVEREREARKGELPAEIKELETFVKRRIDEGPWGKAQAAAGMAV